MMVMMMMMMMMMMMIIMIAALIRSGPLPTEFHMLALACQST